MRKTSRYLEVEYDNGERDKCDPDNIFPPDVPIDFGKEVYDLQVLLVLGAIAWSLLCSI